MNSRDSKIAPPAVVRATAALLVISATTLAGGVPQKHPAPDTVEVDLSPRAWPEGTLDASLAANQRFFERHAAEGESGMVVATTGAPAVEAGLAALRAGGSSVDAALTTALTQVTLAGGAWVSYAGFLSLLHYDAATGTVHSMNAAYDTLRDEIEPLSIPEPATPSGRTVLVSGFMAGVESAHQRFGRLPFAAIYQPAIWFAEEGFAVGPMLAGMIGYRAEVLSRRAATRAVFETSEGTLIGAGERFRQPALAKTLRGVAARGATYMYEGEWAKALVAAVGEEGGLLSLEDLASYRVLWDEPLSAAYGDYRLYAPAAPNFGGAGLIEALNVVEASGILGESHYSMDPAALYDLIRISRLVEVLGVPGQGRVDARPLVAERFPQLAVDTPARVTGEHAARVWAAMSTEDWNALVRDALEAAVKTGPPDHSDSVIVVDREGDATVLTHTINTNTWGTTGIFVGGVSIPDSAAYQQERIAEAGPGARLPDATNPILVLDEDGLRLASGAIGSGLHAASMQSLLDVLDYRMTPHQASEAAHFGRSLIDPEEAHLQGMPQGRFSPEILAALGERGQETREIAGPAMMRIAGYWVGIRIDPETGRRQGGGQTLNGVAKGE